MSTFSGFSAQTFQFFLNLQANNDRTWFQAHRVEFITHVQQPFESLIMALTPFLLEIDPMIEIKAPKHMISRIYRDVRFSKDKSPYRSNVWISFHRSTEDWKADPTFFFELMPTSYRYGMGFYTPSKVFMETLRGRVLSHPAEFHDFSQALSPHTAFLLMGTTYKRPLVPPVPVYTALMPWYQKRNELYVVASNPIDATVQSAALVPHLAHEFAILSPLYHFFWQLKGIAGENNRGP